MGDSISNLYISGFENVNQIYTYDIDQLNNGYIKTSDIDTTNLNANGKAI